MLLLTAYQSTTYEKDEQGNTTAVKGLWYPRIIKYGDTVTTKELAHALSQRSSLSPGDVRSLVEDLFDVM
jgi:hypothetical protein